MAQIKVNELSGAALDWAVAKCEGATDDWHTDNPFFWCGVPCVREYGRDVNYTPSTNWAQGGPIIERKAISTCWQATTWVATLFNKNCGETWYGHHYGPTPLIAAMRCHVASKMGNVVEVPDELIK